MTSLVILLIAAVLAAGVYWLSSVKLTLHPFLVMLLTLFVFGLVWQVVPALGLR